MGGFGGNTTMSTELYMELLNHYLVPQKLIKHGMLTTQKFREERNLKNKYNKTKHSFKKHFVPMILEAGGGSGEEEDLQHFHLLKEKCLSLRYSCC